MSDAYEYGVSEHEEHGFNTDKSNDPGFNPHDHSTPDHYEPDHKIRLWQFEDLKGIVELERLAFSDSWSEAAVYYALDSIEPVEAFALVVPHEDEIIAYGLFQGVFENWEVFRIAVHPDWRRQGFARSILLEAIGMMKRSKGEKLYLEVREHNRPARRLYESLGFRPFSSRTNYYADGSDAILYRLNFADDEV